jgi:hypothetical protein
MTGYDFEDRGKTLYFPGSHWGKHNELAVHGRKDDLVVVKVPALTAYISRGTGSHYCPAEFLVLQKRGASAMPGYTHAELLIAIPLRVV